MKPGNILTGGHQRRTHPDCPICVARAAGTSPIDPPSARPDHVYVTADREYARFYASMWGYGDLYRVQPVGDLTPSIEDHFPTWTAPAAVVIAVYARAVLLTMTQRRALYRRWMALDLAAEGSEVTPSRFTDTCGEESCTACLKPADHCTCQEEPDAP
jgi:hypothetical protein